VVKQGAYEQKPIQGTAKKQFQLHFCWEADEVAPPSPTKGKKRSKKKGKKESVPLATPLTVKRERSSEHILRKRPEAYTRQQALAQTEAKEPARDGDELPEVEELLGIAH
jgi:hypothetical protein